MKNIVVQKFGGTSLGSIERIKAVANTIKKTSLNEFPIIVVSAMSGETDKLINLAKDISDAPAERELDALLSTGEKVSAALLAMTLQSLGLKAKSFSAAQISMRTTSNHSKAKIIDINIDTIQASIDEACIPVITGFQGINDVGDVTTLGRGGSDTTAVAIAASIKAERCDIYTDVDGIYTTDPNLVPEAKKLRSITTEEMLELSGQGAKVMQVRAMEFANRYDVPIRVLSSFEEGEGTLITKEISSMEQPIITGIAMQDNQTKFTLHGVEDTPGNASGILGPIGDAGIDVDVIVQNVSVSGKTDFTFTIGNSDAKKAQKILESNLIKVNYDKLIVNNEIGKVSIVGVGMRSHAGVAANMFKALAEVGVNIQMISTSEIKISVIIEEKFLELAIRTLHSAFGLDQPEVGEAQD